MILRERLKPNPQPRFLVVNPGLKTIGIFCRAIPLPIRYINMNSFCFFLDVDDIPADVKLNIDLTAKRAK